MRGLNSSRLINRATSESKRIVENNLLAQGWEFGNWLQNFWDWECGGRLVQPVFDRENASKIPVTMQTRWRSNYVLVAFGGFVEQM